MERKPWFKPKRFGYGWTPASWQGWAVTLVLLVLPFVFIAWVISRHHPR